MVMSPFDNIIKDKPISGYCPYCHKHVSFSWVYFNKGSGGVQGFLCVGNSYSAGNSYSNEKGIWALAECPSCKNCVLVNIHEGKTSIYPQLLPEPTDDRVPKNIKDDLDEAKICFSVNAFRASTIMCRRVLQKVCELKGATKDKRLVDQIDELLEKNIITQDLDNLAHAVRWVGNDAAHLDDKITKKDAEEILKLTEQFIDVLIIAPEKVKEIKNKYKKGEI